MPMILGTSITLSLFPLRSGALIVTPPSYGRSTVRAGVTSQFNGLVGRSSAPVQVAATTPVLITASPRAKVNFAKRLKCLLRKCVVTNSTLAAAKQVADDARADEDEADHDDGS